MGLRSGHVVFKHPSTNELFHLRRPNHVHTGTVTVDDGQTVTPGIVLMEVRVGEGGPQAEALRSPGGLYWGICRMLVFTEPEVRGF